MNTNALKKMKVGELIALLEEKGMDSTKASKSVLVERLASVTNEVTEETSESKKKAPVAKKASKKVAEKKDSEESAPSKKAPKEKKASKKKAAKKSEDSPAPSTKASKKKVTEETTDLSKNTVPELNILLREKGLATTGRKAEKVARLTNHSQGLPATPSKGAGRPRGVKNGQGKANRRGLTEDDVVQLILIINDESENNLSLHETASVVLSRFMKGDMGDNEFSE